jgi:Protein of unknown function (DUF4238)
MQTIKNQHYVSQFYLRNFGINDRAIWVYDKLLKKSFLDAISTVAAERFFYDVPPDSVASRDPQGVEKALCAMEGKYSAAIKELLDEVEQTGRFTTGPTDRNQTIAHFLIIQELRTKEFRDSYSSMVNQLSAEIKARHEFVRKYMAEKGETVVSENPTKPIPHEMSALAHAQDMFNPSFIDWVVRIFLNHVWLIGDNQTGQHLYTSDAPVTLSSTMPNGVIGYGTRGVEVAIPLSSRFILVLFERSWFTQTRSMKDGEVLKLDRDVVQHYNGRQVGNSVRQVYCQEDQFELATEMIGQYPEVCEPGRSRFTIGGKFA